jgi:hypothetical protein
MRTVSYGIITAGVIAGVSAALAPTVAQAGSVSCFGSGGDSTDFITLSIQVSSCATGNGNGDKILDPLNGYVALETDTFTTATQGSFTVPKGYSSLELIFHSGLGQPHPDDFNITIPYTSSVTWLFKNNTVIDGQSIHTDFVLSAQLFGKPLGTAPLPPAGMLMLMGLVALGLVAYCRPGSAVKTVGLEPT